MTKPKRPGSAFLLFSGEMRSKFKEQHPQATVIEVSAGLGGLWKKMSEKEKEKYNQQYATLKAQYEKDLQYYQDHKTPEDVANENKSKRKYKEKVKDRKKKDPNAPKRPMSAYMFFTQETRKQLPNMTVTEQAKELGSRWAALPEDQRERFVKMADKDKRRYQEEITEYRAQN